jgi:hypothetical protein
VDKYLGEPNIANKSVRVLEDFLWDITKAQGKVLPQIGGSQFFMHRQRSSINDNLQTPSSQQNFKRHQTIMANAADY